MEDFKWLFYIVVAIIYFIVKSKNKKTSEQTSDSKTFDQNQPTTSKSKPVTFEDLLKEIQQGKAPNQPKPQPKAVIQPIAQAPQSRPTKYEDYDDNIEKDEKGLEDVAYDYRDQDKIYETYEKAKKEAFGRASLEETMKVEDTVMQYGKFKEFTKEAVPTLASTIAKDFKDKRNIRRAFILTEVLNRKY